MTPRSHHLNQADTRHVSSDPRLETLEITEQRLSKHVNYFICAVLYEKTRGRLSSKLLR